MERRTAPPPADGRSLPFGNGGRNKALMPAQAAGCPPYNMEREREKERQDTQVALVLPERTASEEGRRGGRLVSVLAEPPR